ncbi:MAG: hypothetical protein WCJ75_06895 [Desulfomonile sp.]
MSEIRSTIDLMMDRTRGMSLSPEEKKRLHMEELRKKAKGFEIKILANPDSSDEIIASINNEPEDDAGILKSLVWNGLVQKMPKGEAVLKHLEILDKLPQAKAKGNILDDLRAILKTSLKNRNKDLKNILNSERKKLAAFGISGSAVVPKLVTDSWINQNTSSKIALNKANLLDSLL